MNAEITRETAHKLAFILDRLEVALPACERLEYR